MINVTILHEMGTNSIAYNEPQLTRLLVAAGPIRWYSTALLSGRN